MIETREQQSLARLIGRWAERLLLGSALVLALAYAVDLGAFAVRGKPVDQVVVNRSLAVPLKGNKTEYDFEGSDAVICSRSLFPQGGHSPCWYLRRHTTQTDKI